MKRGLNIWAVLALAGLAGIVGGLILAQRSHEKAMEQIDRVYEADPHVLRPMRVTGGKEYDMSAPDPESLRGIPVYPGSEPRRMVATPGGALSASWFITDDSVDKVVSFYQKEFETMKVVAFTNRYAGQKVAISWLEADPAKRDAGVQLPRGQLHMVTVMKEGGRTLVMPSTSRPMEILENAQRMPVWFEATPGAGMPRAIDSTFENQTRHIVYFEMIELTASEGMAALRKLYLSKGWSEVGHEVVDSTTERLSLTRKEAILTATVKKSADSVSAVMNFDERGATR